MTEKIDIHRVEKNYNTEIEAIFKDKAISQHNKEVIIRFMNDALIGKTILNKSKKKIKKNTILKHVYGLKLFARYIPCNFEDVQQDQMDQYIQALEGLSGLNSLHKTPLFNHTSLKNTLKQYSNATRVSYKVTLKKFYKWLLGNNETYPPIVRYIDTAITDKEISCPNYETCKNALKYASNQKNRAIIHFLLDSGTRIEEALNVRYKHLNWDSSKYCYSVRIEFSKTMPRTIFLPLCSEDLKIYMDILLQKNGNGTELNPETIIFPYSYNYVRKMLHLWSVKYLHRNITPHMLRHTSATYYASKLNRQVLCKRYGWRLSSRMPDRYIDREGILDEESVKSVQSGMYDSLQKENQELRNEMNILRDQFKSMMLQISKEVLTHVSSRKEQKNDHSTG